MHGEYYAKHYSFDASFEPYVAIPLAEFAMRQSSDERIWIVDSGRVLGSIAVTRAAEDTAQVRWFLLDASLQGQGLGKRLVGEALAFAKAMGYQRIILWTVKGLDAAIHLYLRHGFTLAEEITHYAWGHDLTEQRFELSF
jgi:GNAT superfamily N-acetyltransferase